MKSLTWQQVTQRRLARHALDRPADRADLLDVAGAVCGVQAQVLVAAELALGARVAGLTQQTLQQELWERRRRLVKTYSLRGTLHLHPAGELPLWTAARRALPALRGDGLFAAYGLEPAQAEAILQAFGEALDGRALTRAELAAEVARHVGSWAQERLASTWADLIGLGADTGRLCFGPNQGSQVTFVRPDQWLGGWQEQDPDAALAEVFRRYLAAYGPATPEDFAAWFAGKSLKPGEARALAGSLARDLEEVSVEGRQAWQLAGEAAVPRDAMGHTLRLLPQYDCYLLGCRFGREHIVPEAAKARVFRYKNGRFEGATGLPVLLIDGVVAGMWERRKHGRRVEVRVEPFARLSAAQRRALQAEALRIGEFLEVEAALLVETLE